jgi:hypothetical protein
MEHIAHRPQAAAKQQEHRRKAATDAPVVPLPAEVDPDVDQHLEKELDQPLQDDDQDFFHRNGLRFVERW